MKKLFFVIGLALGGYALGSAQTAATTTPTSSTKAACCQKGGEAKACCSKDAKTTSTASASATGKQCSGHDHGTQKAEAAPAATGVERKDKAKATKTN